MFINYSIIRVCLCFCNWTQTPPESSSSKDVLTLHVITPASSSTSGSLGGVKSLVLAAAGCQETFSASNKHCYMEI